MRGTNKPMKLKQKARGIKKIRILKTYTVLENFYNFLESNRLCETVLPLLNKSYKTNYKFTKEALEDKSGVIYKTFAQKDLNHFNLYALFSRNNFYILHPENATDLELLKLLEIVDYVWNLSVIDYTHKRHKESLTKGRELFLARWDEITKVTDI